MRDEFRQLVIETLRRGEDLPTEWARELFPPEKREYELIYYGKEREEDIIAETMAVPLQPVRTFGNHTDGYNEMLFSNGFNGSGNQEWHNMLILGDNQQVLKTLMEQKKVGLLCNADGTLGIRLIYIDPPFATKRDFNGDQEQKAYQDKIAGATFIEFLRKRLVLLRELLATNGLICIHLDYRYCHLLRCLIEEVFGEANFRNEIIVRRGTKNVQAQFENITQLATGNDTILLFSKFTSTRLRKLTSSLEIEEPGKWDTFWRGTDRPTMRYEILGVTPKNGQWRWSPERGHRAEANYQEYLEKYAPFKTLDEYYIDTLLERNIKLDFVMKDNSGAVKYYVPPRGYKISSNVWMDVSTRGEETGYPTEKHEDLLNRIINWLSNEGDIVLDAFAGSGTTLAVAEKLGRRWIGIDCGKLSIYTVQKRMLNLGNLSNQAETIKPKPFTLYNAGLYDFSALKQLPWKDWRFFALQLFGCRDEPHTIGGLRLDGKYRGASVLVFNHLEHAGKRIDEETISSIHAAVGDKIGRKFHIIAPRGVFDFQQDYIDLGGVRYYAMRIPYSFINELHHREFTALQQPQDEGAVNDLIDSVGFDFIRTPKVTWLVGVEREEAYLKVKEFESYVRLRGSDLYGGLETLSMLMFDFNYDDDIFDLDTVFYSHQLEETSWRASFALENIGERVMAVFIDIHGNEAREIITREQFGIQPPLQAVLETSKEK